MKRLLLTVSYCIGQKPEPAIVKLVQFSTFFLDRLKSDNGTEVLLDKWMINLISNIKSTYVDYVYLGR